MKMKTQRGKEKQERIIKQQNQKKLRPRKVKE